jgi:hypothetical protein
MTAASADAEFGAAPRAGLEHLAGYPLLDALTNRRTRRFGSGMRLPGGPLAYAGTHPVQPLSLAEEAALAFAACGITGHVLADLPFEGGDEPEAGGGKVMTHLVGRTVPSGEAMHSVSLFVANDEGLWLLKRPQDYPRGDVGALAQAARDRTLLDLFQAARIRLADRRPDVPRDPRYVPSFNAWSANVPGTTFFVPVNELTALYINVMLAAFDEPGYFVVDERNRFQPAGVGRFARSRGGHLHDDPAAERIGTVGLTETWLCEFTAIEQGAMLQNLGLMAQALGLGSSLYLAGHPHRWLQALGFRMRDVRLSNTFGAGRPLRLLLRALGKDPPLPTAVGLEAAGGALLKPFCPPYYPTMAAAVRAFVDYKFGEGSGTLRDGGGATAWRDGAAVQAGIPRHSDRAIAATIAYCEYIHGRYGRFPALGGPFRTILAFQAHHVDPEFYDRLYRPEALSETQRHHQERWHGD